MPILRKNTGDSASEMEALYDREDETGETALPEKPEVQPHTDLIDKKLLMGRSVKPGDRIVLEVVAVNSDGVEVKYATEKGAEEPEMSEDEQLTGLTR